jgi:hypothetical protein
MFIGHWSAAFAAGAASERAPRLGTLFIAAQLVDWAFFAFVLIGVERMRVVPGITRLSPLDLYHMPITHSLLGAAGFAAAYGLIVGVGLRDRVAGLITAAVALSHWLLDLLVHRPDLTLAGRPPLLGLGLWDYPWIEIPLELALTFGAFLGYIRRTSGPAIGPIVLAVLLLAMQAFNWFGPPPAANETMAPMALLALAAYALATLAAWWVGTSRRHRAAPD